jgi:hypothetical protein
MYADNPIRIVAGIGLNKTLANQNTLSNNGIRESWSVEYTSVSICNMCIVYLDLYKKRSYDFGHVCSS